MRRLVLILTSGVAAVGLAGPSFATTTVSTPESAPVGASVTVNPVIFVSDDPMSGGTIVQVQPGPVWIQYWGIPDPTEPGGPPEPAGPTDPEQDKEPKDKEPKDKESKDKESKDKDKESKDDKGSD